MSPSISPARLLHHARRWPNLPRPPYHAPLLHCSLALTIGAAVSLTDSQPWSVAAACAVVTLFAVTSAAGMSARTSLRRLNLTLLLFTPVLIGIGFWRAEATQLEPERLGWTELSGQTVHLTGVVIADPELRSTGLRLLLDAESITLGDEHIKIDDQILLNIPEPLAVEYGDRVSVETQLTPTLPATDDYLQWLADQRIAASGLARSGSLDIIDQADIPWWQSLAANARRELNHSLRSALPPPLSGIAQGMITGRRDAIDPELRQDLNDTSLSHLIVISGSNLTLITTLVMAASAWLIGRRPAAILAILAALSYGTLIGPDPPVQRAMWMAIVFATAHLLGRGASALYAIVATIALMVAIEPHIMLDLSFQLTVAGTLGIILLMPSLYQDFLSGQSGIVGSLKEVAVVTLVATIATMPLIILHFGRSALIGIPANVLVAPLFPWMLLGSAATAVLGIISESLASALGWFLAWLPLRWLYLTAVEGAQLPGAGDPVRGFGHLHLLLIYAAMLLASWRPYRERIARWTRANPVTDQSASQRFPHLRNPLNQVGLDFIPNLRSHLSPMLLSGIGAAVAGALWLSACSPPSPTLSVHFIDVGQGDAALIVTPDDHTILIDTGERSADILAALRTHLPDNTRKIDFVVITHPQSDHGEALWAILDDYDIDQVLLSAYVETTPFGQRLVEHLNHQKIDTIEAQPGQQIVFDGETPLTLDILWPPTDRLTPEQLADPNAASIVLRARFGDAAFLFTGDINVEQELELVRAPCPGSSEPCELRADVLKVAHQGSRYSSAMRFLESVRPSLAILSASADNPYGHPHVEVLQSLQHVGSRPLLTAEHGDITATTDGNTIALTTDR